jgi:hypothetical protein
MILSIIGLICAFLFYDYLKNQNNVETVNYTRLDQLIKHLKEYHSINNTDWNEINHIKLTNDSNGLLLGNNESNLSFVNNENITLHINDEKISLNTINTYEAIDKLKELIENLKTTINENKLITNTQLVEENTNKLNKIIFIYDILNDFRNKYYYNKYLKYKNKYLLLKTN